MSVLSHTVNKKQNMRTKTLLLTAVLGLASAATSMAQVYSANVVGYVNEPYPTGLSKTKLNELKYFGHFRNF